MATAGDSMISHSQTFLRFWWGNDIIMQHNSQKANFAFSLFKLTCKLLRFVTNCNNITIHFKRFFFFQIICKKNFKNFFLNNWRNILFLSELTQWWFVRAQPSPKSIRAVLKCLLSFFFNSLQKTILWTFTSLPILQNKVIPVEMVVMLP